MSKIRLKRESEIFKFLYEYHAKKATVYSNLLEIESLKQGRTLKALRYEESYVGCDNTILLEEENEKISRQIEKCHELIDSICDDRGKGIIKEFFFNKRRVVEIAKLYYVSETLVYMELDKWLKKINPIFLKILGNI